MGVWIETLKYLHVSVIMKVTPCMGVWIETLFVIYSPPMLKSHPVWVCGLKLDEQRSMYRIICHTLYGCVD